MEILNNSSQQIIINWYEAFHGHFMYIGLQFGYKREELKDIIHQFFLDLMEKNIDPKSIQDPRAYLSTIFRRKLVDHYRQLGKSRLVVVAALDENYAEPSIQETLEQIQANTELISAIRQAYKKLPKRCRKVIDLKFYQGLTTEQISLQTGLTKRSVYNNLFEGVKLLRAELSNSAPGVSIAALISALPLLLNHL